MLANLVLVNKDPYFDGDVQQKTQHLQYSKRFLWQQLILPRIRVCADVEEQGLTSRQKENNKIKDETKSVNPRSQKSAPKTVVDCSRIFYPKDENVFDERGSGDVQNDLSRNRVLHDDLTEANDGGNWSYDVSDQVSVLAEDVVENAAEAKRGSHFVDQSSSVAVSGLLEPDDSVGEAHVEGGGEEGEEDGGDLRRMVVEEAVVKVVLERIV
jgi:hypothetical protein